MLVHRKHVGRTDKGLFARSTHLQYLRSDCEPADPLNTLTDRLNTLLNSSGPGYTLPLCPSTQYYIQAPILFASPNQEISTVGYPTDDSRATLVVSGPVALGQGHTTAVDGSCPNCNGVKLRNIQVNGTRLGASPTNGGANIEMGGSNSDQLVEYVHSFDPRSWSCLHVAEGALSCNNATIQFNDIGPCGSDAFQQWADGISVSCRNSHVHGNLVNNPTDGGIVLFGAPGTLVENNTIWVENQTLLGGINMVDYEPWSGDYTNTIVRNNTVKGGFSTDKPAAGEQKGANNEDVIVKIGIAIGPRTWFGNQYGTNVSLSGTVLDNFFTGAFGYGIAMTSARNFTVENNMLLGNTSFIGARGPNCTIAPPDPAPFILDSSNVQSSTTQTNFQNITNGDGLTCILPPDGGDFWPFGGNPGPGPSPNPSGSSGGGGRLSSGAKAGLAIAIIALVVFIAIASWFIRKWAINRAAARDPSRSSTGYMRSKEHVPL